jgi:hypothetical protein
LGRLMIRLQIDSPPDLIALLDERRTGTETMLTARWSPPFLLLAADREYPFSLLNKHKEGPKC